MRSADVVVDVAAEAQQLQQSALHQVSVGGVTALDQGLAAVQQGVDASRVLAHTLLEGLHTQQRNTTCNKTEAVKQRGTSEGTDLQPLQLPAGTSCQLIYLCQTDIHLCQPE